MQLDCVATTDQHISKRTGRTGQGGLTVPVTYSIMEVMLSVSVVAILVGPTEVTHHLMLLLLF